MWRTKIQSNLKITKVQLMQMNNWLANNYHLSMFSFHFFFFFLSLFLDSVIQMEIGVVWSPVLFWNSYSSNLPQALQEYSKCKTGWNVKACKQFKIKQDNFFLPLSLLHTSKSWNKHQTSSSQLWYFKTWLWDYGYWNGIQTVIRNVFFFSSYENNCTV